MPRRIEKFRDMDRAELEVQQRELGDQIFRLRFQLTTGQTEGLKRMRQARRDLARIKTLLHEQDLRSKHGS
jgi:large subunit ribosomal protein L29